jgi:hypothetical protein
MVRVHSGLPFLFNGFGPLCHLFNPSFNPHSSPWLIHHISGMAEYRVQHQLLGFGLGPSLLNLSLRSARFPQLECFKPQDAEHRRKSTRRKIDRM